VCFAFFLAPCFFFFSLSLSLSLSSFIDKYYFHVFVNFNFFRLYSSAGEVAEVPLTLRRRFAAMTVALMLDDAHDDDDLNDSHDYLISISPCVLVLGRGVIHGTFEYPDGSLVLGVRVATNPCVVSRNFVGLELFDVTQNKPEVAKCFSCLPFMAWYC
jgi:hypothetical protein